MVAMWVDAAPEFEIEGGVVVVTLFSGGDVVTLSLSRAMFRYAVERGMHAINEADLAERGRVAQMQRRSG